jgi:hypothetical protein
MQIIGLARALNTNAAHVPRKDHDRVNTVDPTRPAGKKPLLQRD